MESGVQVPKEIKIELPYDLAIPLQVYVSEGEIIISKRSCIPMFTVALFTVCEFKL